MGHHPMLARGPRIESGEYICAFMRSGFSGRLHYVPFTVFGVIKREFAGNRNCFECLIHTMYLLYNILYYTEVLYSLLNS